MKKYLLLLFVIPMVANAASMCVKNDTVFVVLDPNISPESTSYDNDARTWSATFSYGTISGIAGCGGYTSLGMTVPAVSTNQSAVSLTATNTSLYTCACKMLLPVESKWINAYYKSSGDPTAACSTLCAARCDSIIRSNPTMRRRIFGNVIE